jgi:hypothetical protein
MCINSLFAPVVVKRGNPLSGVSRSFCGLEGFFPPLQSKDRAL